MDATAAPAAPAPPTGGSHNPPRPLARPRAVPKTSRGPYKKQLSLQQKVDIVKKIDAGATKSDTARRLGVNESTIRGIYKQRSKLLSTVEAAGAEGTAKKSRITRYLQRQQPDDDVEIIDVEEEEVARIAQEILEEAPDFEGFASSL